MAILTDAQIVDIIEKRPNKKLIQFGEKQNKRARLHMYGDGMAFHFTVIEGFEKPFMKELRTKYVQTNKDIFARLEKPIDKVFSARGASTYYNLPPEIAAQAAAIDKMVLNGMSIKKWMADTWRPHFLDDPMGIIFMEVDQQGRCYPTYKSITSIYDYQPDGYGFEYIIFRVTREEKIKAGYKDTENIYRVVDDLYDRMVKIEKKGNNTPSLEATKSIVTLDLFTNMFLDVPAVVNSPIANPEGPGFISIYDKIFDLADQFLLRMSIKLTHDLMHAFPKYYEYADDCLICGGEGKVQGKKCGECYGTGKKLMTRVSDNKLLEYPTKDTPGLKGAPGGYIEPSEIFNKIVAGDLAELEAKMIKTVWGSKSPNGNTKLKPGMGISAAPNGTVTATEVMDNRQPEVETLHPISDSAETRDKFILDHCVVVMLKQWAYIEKGGCSKNYGRRFLIEEPDELLKRYTEAKKERLSDGILSGMYEQYLEAKFQGDGVSLNLHKKLMKVEPFMHYTLQELQTAGVDPEQLKAKLYYGEWLSRIDGDTLIISSVEELNKKFTEYLASKTAPVDPAEKQARLQAELAPKPSNN